MEILNQYLEEIKRLQQKISEYKKENKILETSNLREIPDEINMKE